jgi:hypothetical protein
VSCIWLVKTQVLPVLVISHVDRVCGRLMWKLVLVGGSARLDFMDEKTPRYLDHSEYDHDNELEERKNIGPCPHDVCSLYGSRW